MSTGAERICAVLEGLGVQTVFGLPGTQNVPLYEGLRLSGMRTVLATDELAAAMMAGGYYRASGRVAALFTIPGPGFAYALAGLAEARHDSAALIHVTCTSANAPGQRFQLQKLDQIAMATPVVKRCFRIDTAEQIDGILVEAYASSMEEEPGPVLVEVSPEALSASAQWPAPPSPASVPSPPSAGELDLLLARLTGAQRPILLVGQGSVGAAGQVQALAELLRAPVLTTLSGRGVLPDDHPQSLGRDLGIGIEAANELIGQADLVLALGCKFSHNGTGGFGLRIAETNLVHVDASAEVLQANYPTSLAIKADVPTLLESVLLKLPQPMATGVTAAWTPHLERARRSVLASSGGPEPNVRGEGWGVPSGFFADLRAALPRDAIVVTDSGRHQALARRHYPVLCPRGFLAPSDFQSMGFGLPAAIGAALANPGRAVIALIGDGGLAMSGLELLTAVREGIPVTVIVFNDGQLGLIREQQIRDFGHSHAVALGGLDISALSAAVGADFLSYGPDGANHLKTVIGNGRVTVVEVMLRDSATGRALHASRYVRASARQLFGERLISWIKRLLGRDESPGSGLPPTTSGGNCP